MRNVWTVATNTFREAVRDRVLYNLVFFALLMMGAAILVGQISIGIEQSVIVSLGLTAISVIGIFIAVFIGVGLVSKEMDKRTLYALLAKPVDRWEFLLGKYGGLVMTLTVNTAAMAVGLYVALWTVKHPLERSDWYLLVAVYLILLKLALIVALAMLFSCFTTPFLAILFTVGMYIAGVFAEDLRTMQALDLTPLTMKSLRGISYLLPNFENFNVMEAVAHGRGVPAALVWQDTCVCNAVRGNRAGGGSGCVLSTEPEMKPRKKAGWLLGAVLFAGFAGVWQLQKKIDQEKSAILLEQDQLAFRSGNLVKKLSLEYAPLMGAIYWTRVVQYFGEKHRLHQSNLELLWPLLDITTTLDPHLMPAYRFGSIFLSDSPPRGEGRPDLAVKLLERGIKAESGAVAALPGPWKRVLL